MNLVDSSGWLEYFADGPNAAAFIRPIEDTANLLVPTIVLLEVFKRLLQLSGMEPAARAAACMGKGHMVDLDSQIAVAAAQVGHQLKLALADSVIYATAIKHGATLWTQDAHFQGMASVQYVPARRPEF